MSENVPNAPGAFKRITSGDFRSVLVHVVVCGGYYVCVLGGGMEWVRGRWLCVCAGGGWSGLEVGGYVCVLGGDGVGWR